MKIHKEVREQCTSKCALFFAFTKINIVVDKAINWCYILRRESSENQNTFATDFADIR